MADVVCEPLVDLVPLHAPEALQDVAFVAFQRSTVVPPAGTLALSAVIVTTGAGAANTETPTDALREPPAPEQVSVKVGDVVNAAVSSAPPVLLVPLQAPDAVHEVALVDDQRSTVVPP